jgi:hypothetical protein
MRAMASAKSGTVFFISSSILVTDGLLQILFSFIDPVSLPIVQKLVPIANPMIATILFLGWLVGLGIFLAGLIRMFKTRGASRI